MAASRSPQQLAPIATFIQGLYSLGGYRTWKEFADDAKVSAPQVSDFKNGVAEPSGLNLMKLIEAASRRAEQPSAETAALLAREQQSQFERRLEELAEMVAVGFEALGVEPDQLRPGVDAPSRTQDTQ